MHTEAQPGALSKWEGQAARHDNQIPLPTRLDVIHRASGLCEDCGCSGPMEMHHLRYDEWSTGKLYSIRGRETPDDILLLCRECHLAKHIGPDGCFYKDPEECAGEHDYYDHVFSKEG